MKNKIVYLFIVITIFIIIGLAIILISAINNKNNVSLNGDLANKTKEFTIKDIAINNTIDKCWTIINGTVYDATKVIVNNPNKKALLQKACGRDGLDVYVVNKYNSQELTKEDIKKLFDQLKNYRLGIIAPTTEE